MPNPTQPPAIHPDLESVLVTEEQIQKRVRELGRELKGIYGDEEFTVVAVMNGAILFTADLPKTRSGKIMGRLLKDIAEGRAIGDTTTLADPAVVEKLKSQYEEQE